MKPTALDSLLDVAEAHESLHLLGQPADLGIDESDLAEIDALDVLDRFRRRWGQVKEAGSPTPDK
jgi:hypothetical protein